MKYERMREQYDAVYRRFWKPILTYVKGRVSDPSVAEDIAQEVFIKAYNAADSHDASRGVSSWLRAIARNTVIDWHRSGARREDGGLDVDEVACERLCAESALLGRTERRAALARLAVLTKLQRRALWLRLVRGLSYQEIAEQLDMSLSAVKCVIHRARARLSLEHQFA